VELDKETGRGIQRIEEVVYKETGASSTGLR